MFTAAVHCLNRVVGRDPVNRLYEIERVRILSMVSGNGNMPDSILWSRVRITYDEGRIILLVLLLLLLLLLLLDTNLPVNSLDDSIMLPILLKVIIVVGILPVNLFDDAVI